jgi:hypothetical protein
MKFGLDVATSGDFADPRKLAVRHRWLVTLSPDTVEEYREFIRKVPPR